MKFAIEVVNQKNSSGVASKVTPDDDERKINQRK